MIIKDNVFAQAGKQDPEKTTADFRQGMIPNTVAMAEDVNTYGNWSDRDLKVVCDELVAALRGQGITPNNSYVPGEATQLDTLLKTKMKSGFLLTGLDYSSYETPPTQNGASVVFPELRVGFNASVYYGNTQEDITFVDIPAQTLTANSTWSDGVNYIFATPQGTLSHQTSPVLGQDGDTKCYLGSLFVIDGSIQANSWKFTPWLQITAPTVRESPTASRKGGYITPRSGVTLTMGAVEILSEGINFQVNPQLPSIVSFAEKDPFTYRYMYPTYDPNQGNVSEVDTTHLYNMTSGTWDDISALAGKYICVVPCIVPSGQTLMIPAMSYKTGDKYDSVFDTVEDARNAIYGLQYKLNRKLEDGTEGGSVASRCIYLGQTLIVKVGTDDFTNPDNFANVGQVPQALAGFTDASGQTGGGAGAYIPMPQIIRTDNFTAQTNAATLIQGRTDHAVQVTFPNAVPNIINQLEIHYRHAEGMQGVTFPTGTVWWGSAPTWVAGNLYNIIFEWVVDKWVGGYLTTSA